MSERSDGGPAFPMQPLVRDPGGVIRFRANRIVRFLLEEVSYDLNQLYLMGFGEDEWEQFAQLIGYSVSGFGELDYASNDAYATAEKRAGAIAEKQRREAATCDTTQSKNGSGQ